MALMEIRDSRLYRGEFKSFEDYAVTRWGLERQRAYQLIGAVEVVKALGKDGPINEGQARELVPILHNGKPDQITEVWKQVQASGKPITAASIREVVRQHVIPTVGVPTPTETQRLVGSINRLTLEVAKWLTSKPKPRAKDKAAVEGAMSKLVSTLRGESTK